MDPTTLTALTILNELRDAAIDALDRKHKHPSLLLFYSFIDICASLAQEQDLGNRQSFESYLKHYALTSWKAFNSYDLWSARSSILHAYSAYGHHTTKKNGTKPIFYYAWPETREQIDATLQSGGHRDYILININTIKNLAISAFNSLWIRIENDLEFEKVFRQNSENLLKDSHFIALESTFKFIDALNTTSENPETA